jgi:hypothetical protein
MKAGWEFGELGTVFGDHWWRVEEVSGDTAYIRLVYSTRFREDRIDEWPIVPWPVEHLLNDPHWTKVWPK